MSINERARAALLYPKRFDWPVFPAKGKVPLTPNGFRDATKDPTQIRAWWREYPDANVAIPTGSISGFDALDIDLRHGGEGSLDELVRQHGPLPETAESLTGGGGHHVLFKHGEGVKNAADIKPGIDVRGDGGYIVVPPSMHESGRSYAWEQSSRPEDVDIAEWPRWLLALLPSRNGSTPPAPAVGEEIPEGRRNATFCSLAGTMRARDMSRGAIEAALFEENKKCSPPLSENEIKKIAGSVSRYPAPEPTKPSKAPSGGFAGSEPERFGEAEWPEPEALPEGLPPVEPFPFELLPGSLRPWVEDIAERMQCPPDYLAVGAMVALGATVGRQVGIRPRRQDDWLVVPNLWGIAVGNPGLMKSPALAEVLKPLRRLEAEARDEYQGIVVEYEAERMVADAEKKQAEDEVKKAVKEGVGDPKAMALEAVNAAVQEPQRQRYIVNDTTVEKLGELLAANLRGLMLFRDELSGFLRMLDKEGNEGARAFYLEGWAGSGAEFTYDRIGRGTIDLPPPCISVLGAMTNGTWTSYVYRAAQGGVGDDGLVQRFQLAVWPDTSGKWENHDRWPNAKAKDDAYAVYYRLDKLTDVDASEESIPFVRFTAEAHSIFDAWRTELENRIRNDDESPMILAHLGKYRSLIPSLALLYSLAENEPGDVGVEALEVACAWGEYLESHARRLYSAALTPETAAARALARRIEKGNLPRQFSIRDVYQKGWQYLTTPVVVREAAKLLEAHYWLRVDIVKTKGRSTEICTVNPKVCVKETGNGQVA